MELFTLHVLAIVQEVACQDWYNTLSSILQNYFFFPVQLANSIVSRKPWKVILSWYHPHNIIQDVHAFNLKDHGTSKPAYTQGLPGIVILQEPCKLRPTTKKLKIAANGNFVSCKSSAHWDPTSKEVQNCRLFLKGACSKKTYGDLSSSLKKITEFALKS